MKKALPVIIAVVLIAVVLAVGVPMAVSFFSKPTPKRSAETFLSLIGKNSYSTATDHMSRRFRKQLDEKGLEDMAEKSGLAQFASVDWVREQVKDRDVALDGVVKTQAGETIVVRVNVSQDKEERWVVDAVIIKEGGKSDEKSDEDSPEETGGKQP